MTRCFAVMLVRPSAFRARMLRVGVRYGCVPVVVGVWRLLFGVIVTVGPAVGWSGWFSVVFASYGLDAGVRILVENRRGGKVGRGWIRSR
jgi:hypothetical protein